MTDKPKKLTPKERLFVTEYCVDFNASRAALCAGYSKKTAGQIGHNMLKKPHILDAINKELEGRIKRVNVNQDWVLYKLQVVVHRCLQLEKTSDGKEYQFNAAGANKALELIGKHFQMFTDNIHIEDLETLLNLSNENRIDAIIEILNTARTRAAGNVAESTGLEQPKDGKIH